MRCALCIAQSPRQGATEHSASSATRGFLPPLRGLKDHFLSIGEPSVENAGLLSTAPAGQMFRIWVFEFADPLMQSRGHGTQRSRGASCFIPEWGGSLFATCVSGWNAISLMLESPRQG